MAERDHGSGVTDRDGRSPVSEQPQQYDPQGTSGGVAQPTTSTYHRPTVTEESSSSSSDDKRRQQRRDLQWYGDWMAANEPETQNTIPSRGDSLTSDWPYTPRHRSADDVSSSARATGQGSQQETERRVRNQPRYRDAAPRHETQQQEFGGPSTQSSGMRVRDTLVPSASAPRRPEGRSHTVSAGSPYSTPSQQSPSSARKRVASTSISNDPRRDFQPTTALSTSSSSPLSRPPLQQPGSSEQQHSFRYLVLPRWQPDAEAVNCFVCGSEFSWYLRRHHCRKCGRVVCASCSQHRIRMPSEFVIQPPGSMAVSSMLPTLTGSGEYQPAGTSSYSTGVLDETNSETVRVCNPCVPDPNLSPPPSQQPHSVPAPPPFSYVQQDPSDISAVARDPVLERQLPLSPSRHPRSSSRTIPHRGRPPPPYHQIQSPVSSLSPPRSTDRTRSPTSPLSSHRHRHTQSAAQARQRSTTPPPRIAASSAPRAVAPLPPRRSRPQIPEEDECPICHLELPARGADGDLTAREQHVANCVQANMNTPGSGQRHASPNFGARLDRAIAMQQGSTSAQGSASSSTAHDLPPEDRPPGVPRRLTGLGMLVYKATEKDCVTEDGGEQECIICLMEFEVGDEMARMECFCKFHKKCLRSWWNTKGNGSCPTHQLHD